METVHAREAALWNQTEKKRCGRRPNHSRQQLIHRALEIARRRGVEGDVSGAIKFAKKSLSLFSTEQASQFLSTLSESSADGPSFASGTSATSTPSGGQGPTPRRAEPPGHRQGSQNTQYTSEQIAVVERVRKCQHHQYYEILELKQDANDSEIKRRFEYSTATNL